MSDTPDSAQREYWDTVAGPKWIRLGLAIESRLEQVNQLLLTQARPMPGERVLEVGCGTGPTTLPVAVAVEKAGSVLGIDIAEPMLMAARERVLAAGLPNITLELADAQTHSFEPNGFDLVVSRFGVMFFEHPVAAFANMLEALRPGGRLCFVCWAGIAENPHWQLPFDIAVRHLGPPSPRPPHAPGPLAFSDKTYVAAILAEAGFAGISVTAANCDLVGASMQQEVDMACEMGPSGSLVVERQPDAASLQAVKDEITVAFAPYMMGSQIVLPAGLLVVQANKPSLSR